MNSAPTNIQNPPNLHDNLQAQIELNHQLIQELPGMKEVLMNSLRINKKLHGEIIAREHSVRNQAQQSHLKLSSLYRDMEEIYAKTQQLYEQTVRQNQKTRFMAEELLKPFRDELRGKVDETILSLKMKMMLSKFDNIGHIISYDKQGKAIYDNQNHTFQFVRTQLLPLVSKLEHELKEKTITAQRQQEQLSVLHDKQEQLQKGVLKSREMIFQVKSSLIDEIAIKLTDEVWDFRLNSFYNAFIRTNLNAIAHTISNNHKELSQEMTNVKNEVASLVNKSYDQKINQNRKKIDQMKGQINKISIIRINQDSIIADLKKNIEQNKISFQRQFSKLSQTANKEQINHLLEESKNIKQQVENISEQLRSQLDKALQDNDKNLLIRVNKLDSDFKMISQHVKLTQKQLQSEQHEITLIKDLLAKKANFTDIIVHTENKVDKQDYQQLKYLIQTKQTPVDSKPYTDPQLDLDSCMITQEQVKDDFTLTPNRFRKRQSISGRKNQHSVSPFIPDLDRDDSVKRYMLGLKNGVNNYTRENLLKEKGRFMFLNQTQRRQAKNVRKGEIFTDDNI